MCFLSTPFSLEPALQPWHPRSSTSRRGLLPPLLGNWLVLRSCVCCNLHLPLPLCINVDLCAYVCVLAFLLVCVCLQMCDWLVAFVHFTLHCQLLVLLLICGIILVQLHVALPLCIHFLDICTCASMLLWTSTIVHCLLPLLCMCCRTSKGLVRNRLTPLRGLPRTITHARCMIALHATAVCFGFAFVFVLCCCKASACVLQLCVHVCCCHVLCTCVHIVGSGCCMQQPLQGLA